MRFLADESCDFRVVVALRQAGHDVLSVVETAPGTLPERIVAEVGRLGTEMGGAFVVLTPERTRVVRVGAPRSRLPSDE